MLRPLRFLWKQLNGPQVTGLLTAVFRWMQNAFSGHIDYFNNFSIDTAIDDHLTLIGACMGINRPIIVLKSAEFFLFTLDEEHGSTHGYSDLANMSHGGVFSDLNQDVAIDKATLCPAEQYRVILQAFRDFNGEAYSVGFILALVENIWTINHPDQDVTTSGIGMRFYQPGDPGFGTRVTYGDVQVYMGPTTAWGSNEEAAVMWQSILNGIFNNLVAPNFHVVVELGSFPT